MSISNYIPKKNPQFHPKVTTVVNGRVPKQLYDATAKILKEEDHSWAEFLTACLLSYLEERGIKNK